MQRHSSLFYSGEGRAPRGLSKPPLSATAKMVTFNRIYATYLKADHSLASADVSLQHIYPGLDVIAGGFDYIQKRLYKNSLNVVRRDTTVLYYDCTNYFFETEQADPTCVEKDAEGNETGTVGLDNMAPPSNIAPIL